MSFGRSPNRREPDRSAAAVFHEFVVSRQVSVVTGQRLPPAADDYLLMQNELENPTW